MSKFSEIRQDDQVSDVPERFYQRFSEKGQIINPGWPRITTEESEGLFSPRENGLKIILINAPIREWSYPNIAPIGQAYIASVAVMDGHTVDVLDLNAARRGPISASMEDYGEEVLGEVRRQLKTGKPDVIGVGGIVTQYKWIKRIAAVCKEAYPDVPIVMGGGVGSCMPQFMLSRLPIDLVVREEGEVTFSELLHRLEVGADLAGLKGTVYRRRTTGGAWVIEDNGPRASVQAGEQGLDALPWPLRSRWPVDDVYKRNPVGHLNWQSKWVDGGSLGMKYSAEMIASRGCPYGVKACDYCYSSYLGKKYRSRSPKDVVDEMEYLWQRYGVHYIHFLDDLLLTNYQWVIALCDELRKRQVNGFEVMWGGACRTNIVADDILRARREGRPNILELAYEVGMRQVGYGVESASPRILKAIDKSGQTVDKMELAIRETQRVMGYADCSFMIGSPGEDQETVRETLDFCRKVDLKPEVFFFVTAYPATTFWELALEKGILTKSVTGTPGPADDDIIERYLLDLGEQGEELRTNLSGLPDQEVIDLSWWAINELGAQNTVRHPHTGDVQLRTKPVAGVVGGEDT